MSYDTYEERPEPVTDAAGVASAITGLVTGVGGMLVLAGLISAAEANSLGIALTAAYSAVATLVGVILPIYKARQARNKVTPLADPKDNSGNALVPAA